MPATARRCLRTTTGQWATWPGMDGAGDGHEPPVDADAKRGAHGRRPLSEGNSGSPTTCTAGAAMGHQSKSAQTTDVIMDHVSNTVAVGNLVNAAEFGGLVNATSLPGIGWRTRHMVIRFSALDTAGAETDRATTTRREAMQRLAALGLAIAGVGLPLATVAKGSRGKAGQKEEDTGEERAAKGRRRGAGHGTVNAEITLPDLPDPKLTALAGKTKILSIGSLTPQNTRLVTAQGTITFDRELVVLMKAGREFRLRCEIWGQDGGCALPSDFLFSLSKPSASIVYNSAVIPANTGALKKNFTFQEPVVSSRLNEDVDTLLDFCNDDEDDIAAHLVVETRVSRSSTRWVRVFEYVSAEVQGHF